MGPPIGFTCMGILTITKELILSVRIIYTLSQVWCIEVSYTPDLIKVKVSPPVSITQISVKDRRDETNFPKQSSICQKRRKMSLIMCFDHVFTAIAM